MSTIATTTNTTPFIYPSTTLLDRDPVNGYLYAMVKGTTANTYDVYRSANGGTTWGLFITTTRANVSEIGSFFIATNQRLYWVYRTNESSEDRIYFRVLDIATTTWNTELLVTSAANGGVAGAVFTGMDLHLVDWNHGLWIAVAVGMTSGAQVGVSMYGVFFNSGLNIYYAEPNVFSGTRQWFYTGSGRITPSIDIAHVGDGKGSIVPHLWISFGRSKSLLVRMAWNGGWWGPVSYVTLNDAVNTQNSITGRWDGTRFVVAVQNPGATDTVLLYERDAANSTTTTRTTPAHPTGVVRNCTVSYNASTGDTRIYAVGTSTTVLYYIDWIRQSGTWSSWSTVLASAVLGTTGDNYGVRRGSSGNTRHDVYSAVSGSPNTLTHTQQLLTYAPSTPTWVTGAAYENGGAADVAVSLLLDWTFTDADPADTQSAYAVSRQIGAGALNYWRASDSTWQVAEVKNTSGTSAITLASSWAAGSDANYTFKAKVWDSTDVASSYSAGLIIVPSAKVNPTITAPTAAQVLATSYVTATWTASEQTQFRVTLTTGGNVVSDSGWVASSALTYTPPYVLPDNSSWTLGLTTKNNEGLASTTQTVAFTVDYLEPPTPTLVATPAPASGWIAVAITNPAVVGSQPALLTQDLWRRTLTTGQTPLNPNDTFEVNAADWTGVGGTAARSTVQAHAGVGSLLVTPTGGIADSYGESGKQAVTQGVLYGAGAWVRATTANKSVKIQLRWYDVSNVFVSASTWSGIPAATAWQYWYVADVPPPTATKVSIAVGLTSTPASGDTGYVDEARLTVASPDVGVRVATGLASGATYNDWKAVSGVAYEYRVLANGVNGTAVYSPWTV